MKKSTFVILFVVAAMIFSLAASAFADKGRSDYYTDVEYWLRELRLAIEAGNQARINEVMAKLRTAVYEAIRYLTSIGEYDARLMGILDRANEAVAKKDVAPITEADVVADIVLNVKDEEKKPQEQNHS